MCGKVHPTFTEVSTLNIDNDHMGNTVCWKKYKEINIIDVHSLEQINVMMRE